MSWWNAKYTNDNGEYEITFGSQDYEKAKAVEKVCCAVIDKTVKSLDDVAIVRHGRWVHKPQMYRHPNAKNYYCSECREETAACGNFCPCCGAKMYKEE